MPAVKITHAISFSSEDPNFPAENITRSETFKKWKCKSPGEKQASVILQLEKASVISSIDIGNECSAFVEVLVGRSGATSDDFQVLLVASSFMSPLEARNGTPANRVRMFGREHLSKPAVDEKWDQVKIVCTQPFNRSIQYGLSFITIHSPEIEDESMSHTTLGRFTVEEDDEIIPVGSLFAKHKETKEPTLTGAAAIRKASQPSSLMGDDLKTTKNVERGVKLNQNETSAKKTSTKPLETEGESSPKEFQKDQKPHKDPAIDSKEKANTSKERDTPRSKRVKPSIRPSHRESPPPKKKTKTVIKILRKPFEKLLDGVVFVLSGYQNPLRATLRDKAIEMGAKYKPDWVSGCTHLICAFPNTPKFQQVKGKGSIVNQKWITECHSKRKRLPWRRFALDRSDQDEDESEEEVCEDVSGNLAEDSDTDIQVTIDERGYNSGSGTDEDIERVKLESLRELEAKTAAEDKKLQVKVEEDPYECNTDIDSDNEDLKENRPDTSNMPLPYLPDFYKEKMFYIHSELDFDDKKRLSRYITAFKGSVASSMSPRVNYVLAKLGTDIKMIKAENPTCLIVTPEWVWQCNDSDKLLPTTTYEI